MRWYEDSEGDERVREWFAILPVTIKGETRWLEVVRVRQSYAWVRRAGGWVNVEFMP